MDVSNSRDVALLFKVMRAVTTYLALPSAELRVEKAAKQQNGSDCGIYLIEFVRIYLQVCFFVKMSQSTVK